MLNRLEMLRIFTVVAEAKSFKESATRLGMSPQKITRIIQELETITGEVLFHRNTRSIQITEYGENFLKQVKTVVNDFDHLFTEKPKESDLAGTVKITVSGTLARRHLMQVMKPFMKKYPEILIDIKATDAISDIVEEKIDIGIRVGLLSKDSRLIAKTIKKIDFKIVGSPALIKKYGVPKSIKDLHEMPTTHIMNGNTGRPWTWNLNGEDFTPANCVFCTNDSEVELDAVLSGVGFSQMGTMLIAPYLKSGKLVEVMKDFSTDSWDLYVYRPQRNPVPKRIRLVFDHIVSTLSKALET